MELALTILAGLGVLLFLIGYLGFVLAGFKHHFVTGIISALPVLNIVTVPALWRKASRKVITSALGLIIVTVSWFLGANTGIYKTLGILKGNKQAATQTIITTPTTGNTTTSISPVVTTSSVSNTAKSPYIIDESKLQQLPKKALYSMAFEIVPVTNIQGLKGRVVQVITTNNEQFEGRINSVNASSVSVQGNELPIANIKQVSLMVKKANQ